jgi:acyl dehydratase
MPVLVSSIGHAYEPCVVTVTPRMALSYAAAVGLSGSSYFDDAAAHFCAPPTWCVAAEWMLSGNPDNRRALGVTDDERVRAVHARQDTRFGDPIRVGDELVVSGRVDGVGATPAGARVTSVFELRRRDDMAAVARSEVDTIYRNVETDAGPVAPSEPFSFEPDHAIEKKIVFSEAFSHVYSECSGIWNPIHTERRVALAAGLPGVIVHGSALWAAVHVALDRDDVRIRRLAGRFSSMVMPGDALRLRLVGDYGEGFRFDVVNAQGRTVMSRGVADFDRR